MFVLTVLFLLFVSCTSRLIAKNPTDHVDSFHLNPKNYLSISNFPKGTSESLIRDSTLVRYPNLTETSYAAFITVNESANANMMFWFFESRFKQSNAPVILWLEGGPGCASSMEVNTVGPLLINDDLTLEEKGNPFSWNANYSILFMDNPIGVGFSFADRDAFVTTEDEMAEYLYDALQQFYERFPSQLQNKLFIFGISYGGKYVPSIAQRILLGNLDSANIFLPLAGLGIGSGFVDPLNQVGHYSEFAYDAGLVDGAQKMQMEQEQNTLLGLIASKNWMDAWSSWNNVLGMIGNFSHGANLYDVNTYDPNLYNFPKTVNFLSQPLLAKALHVGTRVFCQDCANFIPGCDPNVYAALQSDMLQSVGHVVEKLIEELPIFFFSGQWDAIVAVPVATRWLENLNWSNTSQWNSSDRTAYYSADPAHDGPVAFIKSYGNLHSAVIRQAGHIVEYHQPQAMKELVSMFIDAHL